jgi:two-component system, OmpR family, response regulator
MTKRVLIVEDDVGLTRLLRDNLAFEGFDVACAGDGREALDCVDATPFDLVLLDLMLPDSPDGFEVCRSLAQRAARTPIIILTARSQKEDKVRGLELGADDYVTKPFAFEELLARVEALARRPRAITSSTLRVADLVLDAATREVSRQGKLVELTPKEYTVLEYLMRHAGRVMSRTLITEYAWGYHFDPGTNIVDVVINHLRKKIDFVPKKLIHTIRGVGYVIREDVAPGKEA